MKRILCLSVIAAILLSLIPITAGAETYENLRYTKYDDHIEITGYSLPATSIDIPAKIDGLPVTSIGYSAFKFCDSLTSITIPSSVTSIGGDAFVGTAYYNDKSNWQNGVLYIGDCLIKANDDELSSSYAINNGTRVIADSAFYWCDSLMSITIPSSVTSIGDWAFYWCDSLTSVTIPDSVTSIGDWAFEYCYSLTSVTIPNSVISIGGSAFYYCKSLTSITIPSSVTSIGNGAFSGCHGLNISVDSGNKNYSDINGVLFNKNKTQIIAYAKDEIQPKYSIPSGVTSIGEFAFCDCYSLTSVTIPSSVTSIGRIAFRHCDSLTSVTIPNSVTSIGDSAFEYCGNLTSITIPGSVISIGDSAFSNCHGLTNVTIPNSVTSISGGAFAECKSLTNITIPNSVTSIGEGAFSWCESLMSVTIPSSVTSIGSNAFSCCYSLTSVTIPNSVTSIGGSVFSGCYGLTNVTISDSVTSIGNNMFLECDNLKSVIIPESVTSIGYSAFYCCSSLTDIYYGGSEADWEKIIIEKYNEALTNAVIHYNNEGLPRIEAPEPVVEGGTIIINAETKNINGDNELFAIGYGEDMVTSAEKLQNGTANLPSEGVTTIKIFCWDSLDTMRPMCKPKIINID